MKKRNIGLFALAFMLIANTFTVKAQHVEITPFMGYATGAGMDTYNYGNLHLDGGMSYGGVFSIGKTEQTMIEFSYTHLNSQLSTDDYSYFGNTVDVNINYYMFGIQKGLMLGGKVIPYGAFALGWVNYNTIDSEIEDENFFNLDLSGGLKIKISEKLGLKLQAKCHFPLIFEGVYFGAGTGGVGAGVGATAVMIQGDFTGGIYYVLK